MVAPQGHITITNYLLNYYAGLDIERRNCHGFTALMKAAMQGRVECVRALMMAGKGERRQGTSQLPHCNRSVLASLTTPLLSL